MAASVTVHVEGVEKLRQALARMDPQRNPSWVGKALVRCAFLVQEIATRDKIRRGGSAPPVPGILTSRTGRLRASIAVDRRLVPSAIEIGTDVVYGAVHELGGRFHPRRPFLQPALEDARLRFGDLFADEWERAVP